MTPVLDGLLFDRAWICASAGAAVAAVSVASLTIVVGRALRGRPAPLRYGLLLAALVVLGIVPAVAATSRLGGWGAVRISNATVDRPVSPRPFLVTPAVPRPAPVADSSHRDEPAQPERVAEPAVVPMRVPTFREVASCLLWVWLGVLVFSVGRMVRDLLRLRTLRRSLTPSPSPAAVDLLREAARSVGLTQPPRLFESAAVPVPVVIGPVRPVVVLPAGMATTLDREKLTAVLLHEAAHVAHGDLWVGLLQHAVAAVFWWCPPVHRLNRRLAEAREEICDDYVVLAQGDGFQLAEVLVEMAAGLREKRQRLAIGTLGAIDEKPALEGRVERLVDLTRKAAPMTRMNRLAMAAAGAFGAAALAIVVATTIHAADEVPAAQPKALTTDKEVVTAETTGVSYKPRVVAVLRIRKADFQADADYHRYCETQVDLVTSPAVLKATLQRPDIAELKCLRGQKDPLSWLTRIVKAQKPRFSEYLTIEAWGPDAIGVDTEEARTLMDAVAQAYMTDVVNREKRELIERRDTIERKYKENMAEAQALLDRYNERVKSLGTADSEKVDTDHRLLLDRQRVLELGQQIAQLASDKLTVETDLGIAERIGEQLDRRLAANRDVLHEQIERIAKESNRVAEQVKELGADKADLLFHKQQIDRLKKITDQMAELLNAAEIEIIKTKQVELLGVRVVGPEGLNMDQLESTRPWPHL
jgi:beta-lactamase regulating signal transducer with metallopeptidase domain